MNVISKFLGVSLFVVGCATSGSGRPFTADASRSRSMEVEGPSARSILSGPATIHAYSSHNGTRLFTVAALKGTDRDCERAPAAAARRETRLEANRVVTFSVPAGQVACVETASRGPHELLWHQMERPSSEGPMLATSSN